MTLKKLIANLAEDCRLDPATVEDLLLALGDMGEEILRKGERFPVGNLGWLYLAPHFKKQAGTGRAAVRFDSSQQTREKLGLGELTFLKPEPDPCPECKKRPVAVRTEDRCSICAVKERRRKTKERGTRSQTKPLRGKIVKEAGPPYLFQTLIVSRTGRGK